jgi:hypothetical protein
MLIKNYVVEEILVLAILTMNTTIIGIFGECLKIDQKNDLKSFIL